MKIKTKHKIVLSVAVIAAVLGVSYGVNQYKSAEQLKKLHQLVTQQFHLAPRTKTNNCVISGALPDSSCTPGAIIATATKDQICSSGYSKSTRDVSESTKNQVYAEYGITAHAAGQYEVDHYISLELGGSNDIANLWPEAAEPKPGFHEKDEVENFLHDKLCSGQISLPEAQELISNQWVEVYKLTH
ncbi:MAG: hypothetical protein P4L74_02430 [Candidatus Doudnabacteria bacterium]|nr:hypothetical protein [Candidatus Doudnabacteria bacterium]